ncbi:hypothetical protein GJ744_002182 [Endocarpon pusillum]|uniref:Uncharacterized protein n=1 Tax=Endocarpon pusillum TaxID=364733 RepID=A0A8H7E0K6_9EURO|nr:hypothetical protein GJ744_002182 [Endocarpon pusillum]
MKVNLDEIIAMRTCASLCKEWIMAGHNNVYRLVASYVMQQLIGSTRPPGHESPNWTLLVIYVNRPTRVQAYLPFCVPAAVPGKRKRPTEGIPPRCGG